MIFKSNLLKGHQTSNTSQTLVSYRKSLKLAMGLMTIRALKHSKYSYLLLAESYLTEKASKHGQSGRSRDSYR